MNIERELRTLISVVSNEESIDSHEASLKILNALKKVSEEEYVKVHTIQIREMEKDDPVLYFLNHEFSYEKVEIDTQLNIPDIPPKIYNFKIEREEFCRLIDVFNENGLYVVMNKTSFYTCSKTSFYTCSKHILLPKYIKNVVEDKSYLALNDDSIFISQGQFSIRKQKGSQIKYRYNYRVNLWDRGACQ